MKVTTWTVRKALNAISDDNKTSIHCYEFYASPVISKPRYFELFFHFPWDFEIVGFNCSYSRSVLSHHIWGCGGIRGGVRENKLMLFVCCLLLFMTVEFEKLLYGLYFKMVLFFLLRKSFKRCNVQMNVCCYERRFTQWSATMSSECTDLLSQEK